MAENFNGPVNFGKRTFTEIKDELLRYIKEQYPEVLSDFTDSSVGSLLIDLNAGVANNLGINIDRAFQETQLAHAQQRASILEIAKTLGFNIPGKRASATVVDFTVDVPALGDGPDTRYLPVLAPGAQAVGGGKFFETTDTVDFGSSKSVLGFLNRTIIPNFDNNGIIQNYTVTKREVVFNGKTTIFKRVIKNEDTIPFLEVILPDDDVVGVEAVALLGGTNFAGDPPDAEFNNLDNKFHEVDYLARQRVFIEDPSVGFNTGTTSENLKAGKWIEVTKKFVKEFTTNGLCKLTFGGGNGDQDFFKDGFAKAGVTGITFLDNFLENTSLGERLKADHTLFVKYRTGGGANSNIGTGVLTKVGNFTMTVSGPRQDLNRSVNRSLRVNNPIPAYGGTDRLSVEQIRNLTKFNFASQKRDVILNDYLIQVNKMPGKFGAPFRANALQDNNKISIPILGLDAEGKLDNVSTTVLKENIAEYLAEFRMINDFVEIQDGKIFNLSFEIELFIDDVNESSIANSVIRAVADFFNINDRQMNEDIFLGPLQNTINDVDGVINILSLKVFNKVGDPYSANIIEQEFVNETTREIRLINNTVYSTESSMFEIKFPEKDIVLLLKKKNDLFA